jgi:cell wall assembly regulator SMI1
VTSADVDRIEAALGCKLPPDYRELLVTHADVLTRASSTLEYFAVPWTEADDIIRGNRDARSYADDMTFGTDEDGELPWPEHHFVVGTNGGGDFWFIDLSAEKEGLWFWQHESHEITQLHATFADYIAKVRGYLANPGSWRW